MNAVDQSSINKAMWSGSRITLAQCNNLKYIWVDDSDANQLTRDIE